MPRSLEYQLDRPTGTRSLILLALALPALLFLLPPFFFRPLERGLDPSYLVALHLAVRDALVFGRDVVFNYGPLSVLSIRHPFAEVRSWILACDIYLLLSIVHSLWCWIQLGLGIPGIIAAYCIALLIDGGGFLLDMPVLLFAIELSYLALLFRTAQPRLLFYAAIPAVLQVFIKLNFGLIGPVVFVAGAVWFCLLRRDWVRLGLTLSLYLLAVTVLAVLLRVDLISYFRGGMEIVSSYNDSMQMTLPGREWYLNSALGVMGAWLLLLLCSVRTVWRDLGRLFIAGASALFLFVLFKQGFVRADGHELFFFMYAPLAVGLSIVALQLRPAPIAWAVFLSVVGFSASDRPGLFTSEHLQNVAKRPSVYRAGLAEIPPVTPTLPGEPPFAAQTIERLKGGQVDIFPWEVADLIAAKLSYVGRPVFQSYVASSPYLDGLNAAFFGSARAPRGLLYRHGTIDGRYPMFDEAATKRELFRYYDADGQDGAFHVLHRRVVPRKLEIGAWEAIDEGMLGKRLMLGERYGADELLELSFDIKYSAFGQLAKTFYKPPELRIRFALDDGTKREFRAVRPILAGGVMVAPFVETDAQVGAWFRGEFSALPRVKSVVVSAVEGWGVEARYGVKVRRLKMVP